MLQLKETTDTLQSRLENTEAKLRAVELDHSMDIDTALVKLEEVKNHPRSCVTTTDFIIINDKICKMILMVLPYVKTGTDL